MENLSPVYFEKQRVLMNCVDLEIAVSLIYKQFILIDPETK